MQFFHSDMIFFPIENNDNKTKIMSKLIVSLILLSQQWEKKLPNKISGDNSFHNHVYSVQFNVKNNNKGITL